ncbi:hypothetical protein GMOD_00000819 [Pyrenophora seminiperda CCB06]|uniref:Uncharacterized protein n=1 Tax=Pyrenophora seminiperda CCB06 TaxID=1302712 RepID=A0A3M7M8A0_9PLEO|nr:hypothetical protein GMOD_00000819 [Pyrenophora seminiperda CCB06]
MIRVHRDRELNSEKEEGLRPEVEQLLEEQPIGGVTCRFPEPDYRGPLSSSSVLLRSLVHQAVQFLWYRGRSEPWCYDFES